MGDAQSAQREAKNDAAAEEERGEVKDAETGQNIDDKSSRSNGQISEINSKADSSIAAFDSHCEEEIAVEAVFSADVDASEPPKEEDTPVESDNIILKELQDEAEADRVVADEMIEMDAKQNDINESFRRFFSNISLKLTVKRGSTDTQDAITRHEPEEELNKPEDIKDPANEITTESHQQDTDLTAAQGAPETTNRTPTDVTTQDFVEEAEEKMKETKEETAPIDTDAGTTSPVGEDAPPEEEPRSTSPTGPDGKEIATQFKKFFTTGIFSGLRKKKSLVEDNVSGKELLDMVENAEQVYNSLQDRQHDEEITSGLKGAGGQLSEEKPQEESLMAESLRADEAKPPAIVVNEILDSQEKDKVQASPLKRLMSSSSFKKLSKKQRARRSSDAKLSDSGEHISDQLMSSTESTDSPPQASAKAVGEEEGAWASFKKLMTPQKRIKRPSVDHEEEPIPGVVDDKTKPGDGEQISDHSTEEGKKRKDSSVSWEAVLCGSGRRRSRKTSDSDEETPHVTKSDHKQDSGAKEAQLGTSNEMEILASSPKQTGSPPEGDEGSAWKSFKKLVTPKRKVKAEDECEAAQDDSYFSIKKLLPGRKDSKSTERHEQGSSDEADKEVASGDEDSETPAVVPLSEFESAETPDQTQTLADVHSDTAKEEDSELQKKLLDEKTQTVLPCDTRPTEAQEILDSKEALGNEELDELTESTSNHQQLSDIPEENTPASVAEEIARDQTITEDLVEITSEAITAPEPVDVTVADETEMISAVSQLTDSSKTSGNTTPVPAEYDVVNTESVLQQVSEIISVSPTEVPVCSEEPSSERVVCSVKHQVLQSSVMDQPKILEIHRGADATSLKTGLSAEEICAVDELAATVQAENISHLSEALSTEIVSEVSTEEFDTAEPAADEVYEVSVSELQENLKESQVSDESRRGVELVSAVPTEDLPKGEETVADQTEQGASQTHFQEGEYAVTSADNTEEAAVEKEIQTPLEDCEAVQNVPEQDLAEEPSPAVADELETPALASDECDVQSETKTMETKQTEQPNEITDEAEKKDPETDRREDTEEQDVLQVLTLEPEEGEVPSINKESVPENLASGEKDSDETKQGEFLSEVTNKSENTEPQTDGAQIDHEKMTAELEVLESPTSESQEDASQFCNKEESVSPDEEDTDQQKQVESLTKGSSGEPENNEPQTDGDKMDHAEAADGIEVIQTQTSESQEDAVQSFNKEVLFSESLSPAEEDKDEQKHSESLTKETDELENKEPQRDGAKIDEVTEVFEVVQTPPESISPAQINTDEQKQVEWHSEGTGEQGNTDTQTDLPKTELCAVTEQSEDTEGLEDVHEGSLESEECRAQSLEKEVILEDAGLPAGTEPKEEPESVTEVEDGPQTENAQETEAAVVPTLDSEAESPREHQEEVKADDGTVTDDLKQQTEVITKSDGQFEESAVSSPYVKDLISQPESDVEESQLPVVQNVEESNTQETEGQTLLEDVLQPEENDIVTEETEIKADSLQDQASDVNVDWETKSIPCNVQVDHKENLSEVVDELQGLTAVHVSSVIEEPGSVQVLETTTSPEKTEAPCVNAAGVSEEPVREVNLPELQESAGVGKTETLPDAEVKVATTDQVVVTYAVTHDLQDLSPEKPAVLVQEPLISSIVSETEFNDTVEAAAPLVRDDVNETAEAGRAVVMMNVPSVEIEVNHRIQVQVMEVDVRSAENTVDAAVEVGVTEDRDVIDVCQESIEEVENFSAAPEIEEERINEEIKVMVQEVMQHVMSDLPESVAESVETLGQAVRQSDAVTGGSEMDEDKSNEAGDQLIENVTDTVMTRENEEAVVIGGDSGTTTEQHGSEDQDQVSTLPGSFDLSVQDHKDEFEEIKDELEKSEVDGTPGDVTTQKSAVKEDDESTVETQGAQTTPTQIPTHTNFRLATPQNTEVISSTGNLESLSSLSLEFKLNIQFGQARVNALPSPPTERTEPLAQAQKSEVGVQAVESVEPEQEGDARQRSESVKQTELNEISVQATETKEQAVHLHSTQTAVISSQPVLQNAAIQGAETPKPAEEMKSTERETPEVQAAELIQPERQSETTAEEPSGQTEEENEQDVWLDAKEEIDKQEETKSSTNEMDEPAELLRDGKQNKQAEPELQFETVFDPEPEDTGSQRDAHKTTGTCENDSEGEDFAVALEELETRSTSVE